MANEKQNPNPLPPEAEGPPGAGSFLGGALRGGVGMAVVGAVVLAAAGAAAAYGMSFTSIAERAASTMNNIIPGKTLEIAAGTAATAKGLMAGAGAAIGAVAGAVLGAPAGAMGGLLGVRQKYVEENVIPQVVSVALEKGRQIGHIEQQAVDMAAFEAEKNSAHAKAGVLSQVNEPKPVLGKWTANAVNEQASLALAGMQPAGRA